MTNENTEATIATEQPIWAYIVPFLILPCSYLLEGVYQTKGTVSREGVYFSLLFIAALIVVMSSSLKRFHNRVLFLVPVFVFLFGLPIQMSNHYGYGYGYGYSYDYNKTLLDFSAGFWVAFGLSVTLSFFALSNDAQTPFLKRHLGSICYLTGTASLLFFFHLTPLVSAIQFGIGLISLAYLLHICIRVWRGRVTVGPGREPEQAMNL